MHYPTVSSRLWPHRAYVPLFASCFEIGFDKWRNTLVDSLSLISQSQVIICCSRLVKEGQCSCFVRRRRSVCVVHLHPEKLCVVILYSGNSTATCVKYRFRTLQAFLNIRNASIVVTSTKTNVGPYSSSNEGIPCWAEIFCHFLYYMMKPIWSSQGTIKILPKNFYRCFGVRIVKTVDELVHGSENKNREHCLAGGWDTQTEAKNTYSIPLRSTKCRDRPPCILPKCIA